ncbi:MAG TPA: hypothetical protein VGC32_18130 [Solirubrobacterales bacterium]
MTRSRFAVASSLLIAALLLLVPATGDATPPRKGGHYTGLITSQQGSEKLFEFRLSFYVSPSGEEVGSFVFPEGAPFGTKCAEGPLGEPAGDRHARIEKGGFEVWFPLEIDDPSVVGNPELGAVHLEGKFGPNGVFFGHLDNRTRANVCRGSWNFKMHAQQR